MLPNMDKLDSNKYIPKDLGIVEDEDAGSDDSEDDQETRSRRVKIEV